MLANVPINDNEIVLLGDFNCDYLPQFKAKEVNDLQFVCDLYRLQQQICLSTRVTEHNKTLIDLFFTSKSELYADCGVVQTSISDHYHYYLSLQVYEKKKVGLCSLKIIFLRNRSLSNAKRFCGKKTREGKSVSN